ncbi:2297_t:CDS:2, partial [Cetraspora pellucida]
MAESNDASNSSSSKIRINLPTYPNQESINESKINNQNMFINQAEEYMKDFSKPANLIEFKQLVDDFETGPPEKILMNALELLSRFEIREQLYKNLFETKFKDTPNNDNIYMHFRNYDIDFLLIHFNIPPKAMVVTSGNIPSADILLSIAK